ncbi:MAG: hypothetical protein KJ578_09515 [Bacteroidetes bacterium]|nr:hypothetical protein [Bacteroidota bacterium]MBU1580183.1 hypothetical protein [Bacteroidota bacterium]MBU2558001.1 hypothetical protein [Bacteroidota bacterium]
MRIVLSLILMFSSFFVFGQSGIKYEKEESVCREAFPDEALLQLQPLLDQSKRIRFYKETDQDGINYEVKLKFEGNFYSIEYDSSNNLKDIERLMSWKKYNMPAKLVMQQFMDSLFIKYKVKRFQIQDVPNSALESIHYLPLEKDFLIGRNYELELDAILKGQHKPLSFELLFDNSGVLLQRRIISSDLQDNLIY